MSATSLSSNPCSALLLWPRARSTNSPMPAPRLRQTSVFDGTAHRMGLRAKRFAIVAEASKVLYVGVESPGEVKESGVEAVLAHL